MTILLDPINLEAISATSTKGSYFLFENKERLGLFCVVSAHSSQQLSSDFTGIGYQPTITATKYIKKYNIS